MRGGMHLGDFIKGIRVLDLGQYLPGPGAAQILADMGADVLKVEPPAGDPLRKLDPVNGGAVESVSPYYRTVNAGKRVLALDLKSAAGKEVFASLAAVAVSPSQRLPRALRISPPIMIGVVSETGR